MLIECRSQVRARAPSPVDRTPACRQQCPRDENGLTQEPQGTLAVTVQAERVSALDELCDVPGKDGDEERRGKCAEPAPGRLPPGRYERGAEADLDDARPDDHVVGVDRDPGRNLRLELLARPGQVADARGEENGAESYLAGGANDRLCGGHDPSCT